MIAEIPSPGQVRQPANRAVGVASPYEQIRMAFANARSEALSLYIGTKSAIWYMTGSDGLKCDALLREHANQLFDTTDALTERLRGFTGELIDHCEFANCMRVDDIDFVTPEKLLNRLRLENQILTGALRTVCILGRQTSDASEERSLEVWIHEARERAWSLQEAMRFT